MKRGASIAVCGSMPNSVMFSSTCSMACTWLLPPGLPSGRMRLPRWMAMAGLGVSRGRLPGARLAGWLASARDWDPREDGHSPVPGITIVSLDTSLGVAEKALP
ncbi:Uncharacterised protein [Bordetella pertussis]|nr:Uncharacterised protein [Bordetella pertussis]